MFHTELGVPHTDMSVSIHTDAKRRPAVTGQRTYRNKELTNQSSGIILLRSPNLVISVSQYHEKLPQIFE